MADDKDLGLTCGGCDKWLTAADDLIMEPVGRGMVVMFHSSCHQARALKEVGNGVAYRVTE